MAFNSLSFLLFLALVVVVYYLVPKKLQWLVLLIASYGFYLSGGIAHVFYIIGTTLVSYSAARWMQKLRSDLQTKTAAAGEELSKEQKRQLKAAAAKRIHTIQVVSVLLNLAALAYVKYLNFFIGNLNSIFALFHWDASIPFVNALVPLGISYYTFNSIGYLIDVGRGKQEAETHLGKFALFVSFFPYIVQGPLSRYGDVGEQLKQPHSYSHTNVKFGAQLILWGLFKKMVIADRVGLITPMVFDPTFVVYSGSEIFFGVLAYSFQIYCDFSGGADIARGAAQMLGVELPLNFARPFFATSLADFWRRWHMSLGAWMRNYVFYPVMLSKPVTAVSKLFRKRFGSYAGKMVPSVAAPMVVFTLIGIWHGLTWQYIVNGLYNATIISASVALAPLYQKLAQKLRIRTESFGFRLFQMLRTFLVLCISRIIVKAPSLKEAFRMIKALFTRVDLSFFTGVDGRIFEFGVNRQEMLLLFLCVMLLLVIGILQEKGIKIRETIAQQNVFIRWSLVIGMIFVVMIFGVYGPGYNASSFIYGAF